MDLVAGRRVGLGLGLPRIEPGQPHLKLSINFLPNAVYEPSACIRTSLAAADRFGLSRSQLMFEFTENEKISDSARVQRIIEAYRRFGFITALDDFGSGYAGLGLLASFTPDLIKIDMELLRGIHESRSRQVIVAGIATIAQALGIKVLAEGVESRWARPNSFRHQSEASQSRETRNRTASKRFAA